MKAIVIKQPGGPEVLQLEEILTPTATAGHAVVQIEAAGVNFMDTSQRNGRWPIPMPFVPGWEIAGIVESIGPDVTGVTVGQRVACPFLPKAGGYAEYVSVPAALLVPLPDAISTRQAAALLLQGLTAHALVFAAAEVKPGSTVLVHSAAGGVGRLVTQMAKRAGATVIGTVSHGAKRDAALAALAAGASEVIDYSTQDVAFEARRMTEGLGVQVVFDAVGQETLEGSLNALGRRGALIAYGSGSGPAPLVDLSALERLGSLSVTRVNATDYFTTPEEFGPAIHDLFTWVLTGELNLLIGRELSLEEVSEAHRLIENRTTTGKLLLIP
jgi:NADPH:quinone reductase